MWDRKKGNGMWQAVVLAAMLLTHNGDHAHTREERLQDFDVQIEKLEKIADVYQDKANAIMLEAQPLMRLQWKEYTERVEEAEKYGRLAMQTRRQIDQLKKEKDKIIEKYQIQDIKNGHGPHATL
jgi:hypothetical protein